MINLRTPILFGATALLLTGCTTEETLPPLDTAEPQAGEVIEERQGALVAEFVYPRSWGGEGVEVQAQFLDARGVDVQSALAALEVWTPRPGLDIGDCQLIEPPVSSNADTMALHLLDVGPISIASPDERLELPPRRFPDLLSSFHGVVYGSEWSWERDANLVEYYPGSVYQFSAPGTSYAGGFDVELVAPDPVVLVAINGEELRGQERLQLDRHRDLELVWDSDPLDTGSMYLDVIAGHSHQSPRLQCRTTDDGAFTIPSDLLRTVLGDRDGADFAIRRVHSTNTSVDGLDRTDFYFLTTDRLDLSFQ